MFTGAIHIEKGVIFLYHVRSLAAILQSSGSLVLQFLIQGAIHIEKGVIFCTLLEV